MNLLAQCIRILFVVVSIFGAVVVYGQKGPDCVKASKITRPTWLYIKPAKLDDFYLSFGGGVNFKSMKIVKSETAYYLIANETAGSRVFAFELELKRKKLYLSKKLPVHICSEGNLSLDSFLQEDGKIAGCRIGAHSIISFQKS